ncbi:carboxypeptidase regulatory-like domain-containing protein [Oscillatoria sp. FACHB-1407]|uniref:carboxypeptidase-like regulatory domain-containing protein n=1 Tax=Oscillatoria sp. FACHB-1407 TaxID=2692847 RepID=UPI001689BFE5|nr:carboxypeptidase-like regulatory domain-containing protein [Oscillatoria sp. FACHB-1407]MBD2461020.1 carboxypeptidase regulatory-like domain-containing protein [Oscillatoria sp. FACHB-1407]
MKRTFVIPLALISVVGWQVKAIAHGVGITYEAAQAIALQANYDSGEPMAEAQVSVYSPDDPSTPWLKGTADESGRFVFVPDSSIPGNWEVQVRQAGHGEILIIPIGGESGVLGDTTTNGESNSQIASGIGDNLSLPQKGLMAASVIWGFVGTALFFIARKK